MKAKTGYRAWDWAYETLPPALAHPLYLRFGQGLNIADIQTELRLSRATVYRRIRQGLQQLRDTEPRAT